MTTDTPQAEQPETGRRRWAVLAWCRRLSSSSSWTCGSSKSHCRRCSTTSPATLPDVSWILAVYAIVLATLLVPAGRAADSIAHRECFLAGLVVFGIGSLGCALAPKPRTRRVYSEDTQLRA